MTVRELIEELQKCPQDAPVIADNCTIQTVTYAADSAQYLDGYREGSKEAARRILAIVNLEFMREGMTNETYKNLQKGILHVCDDLNNRRVIKEK